MEKRGKGNGGEREKEKMGEIMVKGEEEETAKRGRRRKKKSTGLLHCISSSKITCVCAINCRQVQSKGSTRIVQREQGEDKEYKRKTRSKREIQGVQGEERRRRIR